MATLIRNSTFLLLSAAIGAVTVAVSAPAFADPKTPTPGPTPTANSNVKFEVTGSGSAYTIDTDPGTERFYDVKLPWSLATTIGPDVQLLQVVAVGKDSPGPGCRIILDGKVVAEQPVGGSAHCIFDRS